MGGQVLFGKSARFELLKSDITLEGWGYFGNAHGKEGEMGCEDGGSDGCMEHSSQLEQGLQLIIIHCYCLSLWAFSYSLPNSYFYLPIPPFTPFLPQFTCEQSAMLPIYIPQDMSCCPKGSWQQLSTHYQPKGEDLLINGVPVYHIGQGERTLVIFSDIFGATSGRHRNVADLFASLHYNVYLPEILQTPYEGELGPAIMQNIKGQDQAVMTEKFVKLRAYLESKGVKQYFAVGFCWGVWQAFKMAAKYDDFIAIAGPHPSLGVEKMFGGDDVKLSSQIKCPAFFLPAENDPPNVKPGGEIVQLLAKKFGAEKTGSVEFKEMTHGWVVRGEMEKEAVCRDVNLAIKLIHEYFQKFQ